MSIAAHTVRDMYLPRISATAKPVMLPWLAGALTPMQALAVPLFVGAMRRLLTVPGYQMLGNGSYRNDEARVVVEDYSTVTLTVMDTSRATLNRIRSATSWNGFHPAGSRPFIHYLPHAGYALRAVGLTPSAVYTYARATGVTPQSSDEALLALAHLSKVSVFDVCSAHMYRNLHGWEATDLLGWSLLWEAGHLEAANEAGWTLDELRAMRGTGQVPNADQVVVMSALTRLARIDLPREQSA